MKRITAIMLALTMIIILSACGEVQSSTPTPKPSPTRTPTPTSTPIPTPSLSKTSAKQVAIDYVTQNGPSRFAEKVGSSSVGGITIGEASYDSLDMSLSRVFTHYLSVNGSFYAIDKNGNYGKKYTFSWHLACDDSGNISRVNDWFSISK